MLAVFVLSAMSAGEDLVAVHPAKCEDGCLAHLPQRLLLVLDIAGTCSVRVPALPPHSLSFALSNICVDDT